MDVIQRAKSSRSSCKQCKLKINKDEPRFGKEYEFTRGEKTVTGLSWYHIDCAIKSFPKALATAEIEFELDNETLEKIDKIKNKYSRSAFSIMNVSDIENPDIIVNVKGKIKRVLKPRVDINDQGDEVEVRTVYVYHQEIIRKVILWGDHSNIELKPDHDIVILSGISKLASNDKIEIHATNQSIVLIDVSEEELTKYNNNAELYTAKGWNRPIGTECHFEYAKTGRARCSSCNKQIFKGELKIVKPMWLKNEKTGKYYPGSNSFHVQCVINDEFGTEVLHEAISRLTPDIVLKNKNILVELNDSIPEGEAKTLLTKLIN